MGRNTKRQIDTHYELNSSVPVSTPLNASLISVDTSLYSECAEAGDPLPNLRFLCANIRRSDDANLEIRAIVRRVRGGSQAYLVKASDERFYVAKFQNNPQGNRTLINEWITQGILKRLEVATPDLKVLHLADLAEHPDLYFSAGAHQLRIAPGAHLGSVCPVDPISDTIFDFLPAKLYDHVNNLDEFGKVFVLDRWLNQIDRRQVIYIRDRRKNSSLAMQALFIDNGLALGGTHWRFTDSHLFGLPFGYGDIYSRINMRSVCDSAIDQVVSLSADDIISLVRQVPRPWFSADAEDAQLDRVLHELCRRRVRLPELVTEHLNLLGLIP